jgi:hypothetical protein
MDIFDVVFFRVCFCYADKIIGKNFSSSFIDTITVVCFTVAALLSVYANFIRRKEIWLHCQRI